jgi:hypothetical protein
MLRKGVKITFQNRHSLVSKVYQMILEGNTSKQTIVRRLHIDQSRVQSALWNLTYAGNVKCVRIEGKIRYVLATEDIKPKFDTSSLLTISFIHYDEQ